MKRVLTVALIAAALLASSAAGAVAPSPAAIAGCLAKRQLLVSEQPSRSPYLYARRAVRMLDLSFVAAGDTSGPVERIAIHRSAADAAKGVAALRGWFERPATWGVSAVTLSPFSALVRQRGAAIVIWPGPPEPGREVQPLVRACLAS